MINDYFYSSKYDEKIVLKSEEREISLGLLKRYIVFQVEAFNTVDLKNVLLSDENSLDFVVNFFAAVFSGKEIYLANKKISGIDYFLPSSFKAYEGSYEFSKINPDNVFINFFTSGSTAEPKIIRKTFSNLLNERRDLYEKFHFDNKNLEFCSTSTMSHMFCLTFQFMFPFFSGFVINCSRVLYPEELEVKKDYVLISTPSFLDRIVDYDLKNSPYMIFSAGAKLKKAAFEKFSSCIVEIYGSTEAGVIAYSKGDFFNLFEHVDIEPAENGVFVISDYFIEDKMFLNDNIEMTGEREFILKGRTDRMVKIREKRVSLDEIEKIIISNEFVCDAVCLKHNDKLCSAVVLNNAGKDFVVNNGSLEIIKILKNYLLKETDFVPKKWRFLVEIPKNSRGKIDIEKIKDIFGTNVSYPFILNKKTSKDEAEIEMMFLKNSNFFNGHFPGQPILPGVVQLFFANYFIEDIFGTKLSKDEVKKVKFTNLILPDMKVKLSIKRNSKNFEYTYSDCDKILSSGIFSEYVYEKV